MFSIDRAFVSKRTLTLVCRGAIGTGSSDLSGAHQISSALAKILIRKSVSFDEVNLDLQDVEFNWSDCIFWMYEPAAQAGKGVTYLTSESNHAAFAEVNGSVNIYGTPISARRAVESDLAPDSK